MVSILDTEDKKQIENEMHDDVSRITRDEILDYLVGLTPDEKVIKLKNKPLRLRSLIKLKSDKASNPIKAASSKVQKEDKPKKSRRIIAGAVSLIACQSSKIKLSKLKMALLSLVGVVLLAGSFINKKITKTINAIKSIMSEDSPETVKKLGLTPDQEKAIDDGIQAVSGFIKSSGTLALEYAGQLNNKISVKYPNYKQTVVGAFVLAGCSLSAIVNQAAMPNNTQKADLLTSNKLVAVNWNVNSQVSDAEKQNIKNLLASSEIRVVPRLSQRNKTIKVMADNEKLASASMSPDEPVMVLNSNTLPHTVNTGESILSISKKYKVSISDLISSNPDVDLVNLKAGDSLLIPNNTDMDTENPDNSSRYYTKIPRNLVASRSLSRFFRNGSEDSLSNPSFDTSTLLPSSGMAWPVPQSKVISSKYGPRWGGFHPGIDITAPIGTPIIATKDGVVASSEWSGGYGKCIIIDHGGGVSTRYAHTSIMLVSPGQKVKAGQVIARIGSTGWSTGPHLHYEVLVEGRHQNPLNYL